MGLFNRETPPAAPAAPEAPAPNPDAQPVTRGEFNRLDATLARLAESMEANANRPVVVQQHAPAPPPVPEYTDDEINTAISEGRGAQVFREQLRRSLDRAKAEVANEIGAVREYGTTMLGSLADRTFVAALDAEDKALFTRYEKEIRGLVNQCEPALRGHPQTWETAYNNIIGVHRKELEAEAREAALRQQANENAARGSAPLPGSSGRVRAGAVPTDDTGDVPTLQELAGEDSARILGDMNEDEFIRKMNRGKRSSERYKDFADYVRRGQEIDARLAAIREGDDDGGSGPLPSSLRP